MKNTLSFSSLRKQSLLLQTIGIGALVCIMLISGFPASADAERQISSTAQSVTGDAEAGCVVTLYTLTTCPPCIATKKRLQELGYLGSHPENACVKLEVKVGGISGRYPAFGHKGQITRYSQYGSVEKFAQAIKSKLDELAESDACDCNKYCRCSLVTGSAYCSTKKELTQFNLTPTGRPTCEEAPQCKDYSKERCQVCVCGNKPGTYRCVPKLVAVGKDEKGKTIYRERTGPACSDKKRCEELAKSPACNPSPSPSESPTSTTTPEVTPTPGGGKKIICTDCKVDVDGHVTECYAPGTSPFGKRCVEVVAEEAKVYGEAAAKKCESKKVGDPCGDASPTPSSTPNPSPSS